MKCEYCENEIPSNAAETCPFCGSSLVNNQESYGGRVVAGEVIDVTCPHCHSVYEIALEEWGESRHCEVCQNQFPLVYGASSAFGFILESDAATFALMKPRGVIRSSPPALNNTFHTLVSTLTYWLL